MSKIKVVHIITKLELGGAQENTLFTVKHLDRHSYEPVLISGTEGILVDEARTLKDVKVHLIPELTREIRPFKDVRALFTMRRILRKLQQEGTRESTGMLPQIIVHTHSSKAGILGRWAARLAGIRCIVHSVHGFSFNDFQPSLVRAFYIFLERITARITTCFIAVSNANREEGIVNGIFTDNNVNLIRSGIDIGSFQVRTSDRVTMRKTLGVDERVPLVAMIACFKPQKAPLDFIRVAKLVLDEIHDVQFLLVGDGVLRPAIEKLIRELEIRDKMLLAGWRRDIPAIMQSIDLLVLTSLWEGLPRVLPEAMASGIPVVATKVNGSPEAVQDGVNGYLLPPRAITLMAQKVIQLVQDPRKARAMGEKGRELVQAFDIWKMVKQQETLYANLSKNGSS
jgi:glycosyltransferase involved in cell wall biosynthesis